MKDRQNIPRMIETNKEKFDIFNQFELNDKDELSIDDFCKKYKKRISLYRRLTIKIKILIKKIIRSN